MEFTSRLVVKDEGYVISSSLAEDINNGVYSTIKYSPSSSVIVDDSTIKIGDYTLSATEEGLMIKNVSGTTTAKIFVDGTIEALQPESDKTPEVDGSTEQEQQESDKTPEVDGSTEQEQQESDGTPELGG